jgi:hypothetical protein
MLTGGCMLRSKPQFILANHLCCLTSLAPLRLPIRDVSRLSSRRWIISLPALDRRGASISDAAVYRTHGQNHSRRHFRAVPEVDSCLEDVGERFVARPALERRRRVLLGSE